MIDDTQLSMPNARALSWDDATTGNGLIAFIGFVAR